MLSRAVKAAAALLIALSALSAPAWAQVQSKIGVYRASPPTLSDGQAAALRLDALGALAVSGSVQASQSGGWTFGLSGPIPAGTNTIGGVTQAGAWTMTLGAGSNTIGNIGNAFALDATAQAGNTNTTAIATATGTSADAATASGANTSVIGALRAIRDRILSTLSVSGTVTSNQGAAGAAAWKVDGSATTQPVSNAALSSIDAKTPAIGMQTRAASSSVTPASDLANIEPAGAPITGATMPAGGTGITGWLSSIWQGIVGRQNYLITSSASLPAGGFLNEGNFVYLGASPSPYTYLNASFYSNQAGTYTVQATDGTNVYTLASGTLPASTLTPVRLPAVPVTATATRYRAFITNGGAAATLAFAAISLSAN